MIKVAILTASPVTLAETDCITHENILEAYQRYIHKILTQVFTDTLAIDIKQIIDARHSLGISRKLLRVYSS